LRPSATASLGRFPTAVVPTFAELRRNAVAGLVVGIVALPLSIALAVAVGVPPVAGLYTAVFGGAVASIFGGSKFNITGPTAALVPVLSHAVLLHGPEALPLVGLMAGLLLLFMSAFRFGRLMRYMPGLVVVGFTAGIALSIAFGQLNNLLAVNGTDPRLEHFHQKLWDTLTHLGTIHPTTPLVGLASLALLVVWMKLPRANRLPATLVTVVAVTAFTWGLGIDTPTIASRYGELPGSLPAPTLNFVRFGLMFDLIPIAVAVAVLGSVESLMSATVADGMASLPVRHDGDRELFGQGLANIVAPVMGGIPATAAIARTAAGVRSGATSRLTGVFHALTVLGATLALGGLAGHIPLAVLAAVLLVVAWNIAEVPEVMKLLKRAPREDLIVLVSTMLITLVFDLTYAIGFGIVASTVLLIRRLASTPAAAQLIPDTSGRVQQVSLELSELVKSRPDVAFFTAQGLLSFHSAAAFEYQLLGSSHKPLILRMKDVRHIDTSGLLTLEGIIEHRQANGGRIILTAIRPDVYPVLERFGIIEILGSDNVFEHTRDAVASIDVAGGHESHPIPFTLRDSPMAVAGG